MEYRKLGRTDLEGSLIGFGCNRIADSAPGADRREVEATLAAAVDRGVNLFDTSNLYHHGESERLLAKVLGGRRDDVILCTKVGAKHWASVMVERWADPLRARLASRGSGSPSGRGQGRGERTASVARSFTPRFLELAVAGSLRRLRTDRIDLLYLHSPPPEVLRDPRPFETLEELRRRGWIRWYGVSFLTATTTDEIVAALEAWPGLAAIQVLIHPLASIDLPRAHGVARRTGAAIVARQALGKGALLDGSSAGERTRAQALLRFAMQRRGVDAVLVGMRSRAHLDENLRALETPPLSPEEMQELSRSTEIR